MALGYTSRDLTLFFASCLMQLSSRAEKRKAASKKYRQENPEKAKASKVAAVAKKPEYYLAKAADWGKNNRIASRVIKQRYKKNHPEKVREQNNKRDKIRKETDPNFKLRKLCRDRIYKALLGLRKSASTARLLGCSSDFFRKHIEKQFVPGMTWENHGSVWELDHILPCAKFHLQHSEEQEVCFHWTNFQPLFVEDNRSKADKVL